MKVNPIEFWQYSYANFIDNRNRAALGEFIVAQSLGVTEPPLSSWEAYDMITDEGIKVEVKTSGYIQGWKQKKPTTPTFDIAKKYGWVGETNEWDNIKDRQADVYVFCLHHEKDIAKECNPLVTENWTFYVVPTSLINEKLAEQKSLRISTLTDFLGIKAVGFDQLREEVLRDR